MSQQVAILLASYNGEQFIRAQIDSILSQSCNDWHLFIRDDDSTDSTFAIEQEYANRYPQQITIVNAPSAKHSSKHNFWTLSQYVLDKTDSEYVMFCDQDDVWTQSKVEDTLRAMKSAEQRFQDRRILVHTDLEVVDKDLNVLGDSFIKYRALDPSCTEVNRIVVQNNVTGCTTKCSAESSYRKHSSSTTSRKSPCMIGGFLWWHPYSVILSFSTNLQLNIANMVAMLLERQKSIARHSS